MIGCCVQSEVGEGKGLQEEVHEVETIVGERMHKGSKQYSIKWVGFADPTWEYSAQFDNSLEDYGWLIDAWKSTSRTVNSTKRHMQRASLTFINNNFM
jgi:hypothetical protein